MRDHVNDAMVRTERMTTIQSILFPVDFSPACVGMAPFVTKGAAMFSAKVTILHVLELPSSGFELLVPPLPEVEEDREQVARSKLNSFLESQFPAHGCTRLLSAGRRIEELQRAIGSHAPVSIAVGPIKDALTEGARKLQADVLVTRFGRSSQPGALGRLRDLTYAVVRDAPCPVLSV